MGTHIKPVVIACQTIKKELYAAIERSAYDGGVKLIDSGLHNFPEKLHNTLQEAIDDCTDYNTILMALGACGNSVFGLSSKNCTLVLPRVDDCITLMLGSRERRILAQKDGGTYFLTEGWMIGERSIWNEYQYAIEKYGLSLGKEIFDEMFRSYRYLAFLKDMVPVPDEFIREAKRIAGEMGLHYKTESGTLDYLCDLLSCNWDSNRFLVLKPGEIIRADIFKFFEDAI